MLDAVTGASGGTPMDHVRFSVRVEDRKRANPRRLVDGSEVKSYGDCQK